MDFGYDINDAQSLLGSLNPNNNGQYQLTSNNLYLNNGMWTQESLNDPTMVNGNSGYMAGDGAQNVKQEYISPESVNQTGYSSSTNIPSNSEFAFDDIMNFDGKQEFDQNKDDNLPAGADSDEINSQIDELIQSATQVPTPESAASISFQSPQNSSSRPTQSKSASESSKVTKPVKKPRSSHNLIEKKYRTNINSKILELRDAVPALRIASENNQTLTMDDLEGLTPLVKLNKASILTKATEYIKHLEYKTELLSNEVFQLRNVLAQFQQVLPQLNTSHGPVIYNNGLPTQQPYVPQLQEHSQAPQQVQPQLVPIPQPQPQPQSRPLPIESSPPLLQSLPQQLQQTQSHSNIKSPHLRSYTDQVNMGLNGFVPTLQQIEAAQLQLQTLQNAANSQRKQHQRQHSHHQDPSMSFGNKMLLGGMTALLGSQMFGEGASDDYDLKGLSFIPLHQLFPALGSESALHIFSFLKVIMVLFGAFTVLEPLILTVLSTLYKDGNGDEKQKKSLKRDSEFSYASIGSSALELTLMRLGFRDFYNDIDKVREFNTKISTEISLHLDQSSTCVNYGWRKVVKYLTETSQINVPDSIPADITDAAKKNDMISQLIELSFTRLVFAKMLLIKIGPLSLSLVGLDKAVDSSMLKIIKLSRSLDPKSPIDENTSRIRDLVNMDTEFIDKGLSLYEGICDCFEWDPTNFYKTVLSWNSDSSPQKSSRTASQLSNVLDLINSSDQVSFVNLVTTIRCQEIFDSNLVKYIKVVVRKEEEENDKEIDEDSTQDERESQDADTDTETDTDSDSTEAIVEEVYSSISEYEKLLPHNSFKLNKCYKFFKLIVKPKGEDLKQIVDIIKNEACDLIDYSSIGNFEDSEVSTNGEVSTTNDKATNAISKDEKISRILKFSSGSKFSSQHLGNTCLVTEENYLLLACSFILFYQSNGEFDKSIQLLKFLNVEGNLSLLSFMALFKVSNILIKELIRKESKLNKSLNNLNQDNTGADEEAGAEDDDDSSTLNLNSNKVLESKLRSLDYYKSDVEQLILKSRLLISQPGGTNNFNKLGLRLKSEVSDQLVKMGKRINGYE